MTNLMTRLLAAAGLCLGLSWSAGAAATNYDFSTLLTNGQNYENATIGDLTMSSEAGNLTYTDSYGGGLFAGTGGDSDITFTFAHAVSNISIRAGDGAGDADAFGITAYAFGSNALLGSWYSPAFGTNDNNQWYTLSIAAVNVGRIVFDPCNSAHCPGQLGALGGVVLTDLNVTAVPEPEMYGMLLAGLAMVGVATRRRNAGKAERATAAVA